jgi:hypothetical protein
MGFLSRLDRHNVGHFPVGLGHAGQLERHACRLDEPFQGFHEGAAELIFRSHVEVQSTRLRVTSVSFDPEQDACDLVPAAFLFPAIVAPIDDELQGKAESFRMLELWRAVARCADDQVVFCPSQDEIVVQELGEQKRLGDLPALLKVERVFEFKDWCRHDTKVVLVFGTPALFQSNPITKKLRFPSWYYISTYN